MNIIKKLEEHILALEKLRNDMLKTKFELEMGNKLPITLGSITSTKGALFSAGYGGAGLTMGTLGYDQNPNYMSTKEALKFCKIHNMTFRKFVKKLKIQSYRERKKKFYVKSDVERIAELRKEHLATSKHWKVRQAAKNLEPVKEGRLNNIIKRLKKYKEQSQ